jgi:hypothetical protein
VVQKFLCTIASSMVRTPYWNYKRVELLIPKTHLPEFLSLLLNPSVTELDCTAFDIYSGCSPKYNRFLLMHALENCPKISKIEFWKTDSASWSPSSRQAVPVRFFKKSWNNLKSIKTQADYLFNKKSLKFIQENFPNIESVSLYR